MKITDKNIAIAKEVEMLWRENPELSYKEAEKLVFNKYENQEEVS